MLNKTLILDANYGMNFLKSDVDENIDGVPLPWTENQNAEVVRDRVAGCAVMDEVHKAFGYYNGGHQWEDAPGFNEV